MPGVEKMLSAHIYTLFGHLKNISVCTVWIYPKSSDCVFMRNLRVQSDIVVNTQLYYKKMSQQKYLDTWF